MIKAMRQHTSAGGIFDGTAPLDTPTDVGVHGILDYAAAAVGGLFDPGHTVPVWLERWELHGSGVTAWSLKIVHTDGTLTWKLPIASGAADTDAMSDEQDKICLWPGEKLEFIATAPPASGTLMAMIIVHDRLID